MHPGIRLLVSSLAGSLLLGLALPASAQIFEPEHEREATERGAASAHQTTRAAEAAEKLRAEPAEVGYEEVLQHPDDVELNYRFANAQVRRGDLKGASATLERILLLAPELAKVRLFQAIVLYRLDDLDGAARELERVAEGITDEELLATVHEYQRRIRRRQRRTRGLFTLSAGAGWDSNRNSAPRSGTLLVRDIRFRLGDGATEKDDASYTGIGELAVERDVGSQEQHTLFARVGTYQVEQDDLHRFDLRSGSAELGLRYRTQPVDWTFRLLGNLVDLSSEKFVRTLAGEARGERRLSPQMRGRAIFRFESLDYDGISDSPRAYLRTGLETTVGGELDFVHSPSHFSLLSLGLRNRSAKKRYYSYYGPLVGVQHTWLPGGGQFVVGTVTFDWNRYKDAQTFLSTKIRRESLVRSRLLYGAPLSFLSAGLLRGPVGESVLSLSAEYLWVSSNLPNFTYDNVKLGFLLTRHWEL